MIKGILRSFFAYGIILGVMYFPYLNNGNIWFWYLACVFIGFGSMGWDR